MVHDTIVDERGPDIGGEDKPTFPRTETD